MTYTEEQINEFVTRFLQWNLPEDFNPDGGISFTKFSKNKEGSIHQYKPTGTNLFTATQAKEMIKLMLGIEQEFNEKWIKWDGDENIFVDFTTVDATLSNGIVKYNSFPSELNWNSNAEPYVKLYKVSESNSVDLSSNCYFMTAKYEIVGPMTELQGKLFTDPNKKLLWSGSGNLVGIPLNEVNENYIIAQVVDPILIEPSVTETPMYEHALKVFSGLNNLTEARPFLIKKDSDLGDYRASLVLFEDDGGSPAFCNKINLYAISDSEEEAVCDLWGKLNKLSSNKFFISGSNCIYMLKFNGEFLMEDRIFV